VFIFFLFRAFQDGVGAIQQIPPVKD